MEIIKPGFFGKTVPADERRIDYDFANEQVIYKNRKIDYLFLGDSITWLWDYNTYFDTDKYLVQRGIGKDCSRYLLKRFDADCIQLKPKNAVVMIGTNDISRCETDLWWHKDGESEAVVLEEYRENIRAMISKCEKKDIEIVFCSVPPSTIASPYDREKRWRMTHQMNIFLKSTGKKYINYFDALTSDGKNFREDLTVDGMHPNARGYEIMAEIAKRELFNRQEL